MTDAAITETPEETSRSVPSPLRGGLGRGYESAEPTRSADATRTGEATVKRLLDVLIAAVLLAVCLPLMAVIGCAIWIDSGAPITFRARRVGKDGRVFTMYKFRTMVRDAPTLLTEYAHLNLGVGMVKIPNDPRVTRTGRWLRAFSLDELPQLWNVLRGDMSLVGPRPLVADEDCQIEGYDRGRLNLSPGMTGFWQILGSARIPRHEMVKIDYRYGANWSLWLDVKILLRTIPHVLARRGL